MTNSQLSTNEPKKPKLSKLLKQKQNQRNGDHMEGYQRGAGRIGEQVQGIRSINGRYKIDREVKNNIENGEAKELTCTTHGHELRGAECWRAGVYKVEGGEIGEKYQEKCNSIISKIYLKKRKKKTLLDLKTLKIL